MIEDVIKLRPQFEELRFADVDSLENVNVPIVLTGSPQSIAAESSAPAAARQQSNVLRVCRIDTCIPCDAGEFARRTSMNKTFQILDA